MHGKIRRLVYWKKHGERQHGVMRLDLEAFEASADGHRYCLVAVVTVEIDKESKTAPHLRAHPKERCREQLSILQRPKLVGHQHLPEWDKQNHAGWSGHQGLTPSTFGSSKTSCSPHEWPERLGKGMYWRSVQDELGQYWWIDHEGLIYQGTLYAAEPDPTQKTLVAVSVMRIYLAKPTMTAPDGACLDRIVTCIVFDARRWPPLDPSENAPFLGQARKRPWPI